MQISRHKTDNGAAAADFVLGAYLSRMAAESFICMSSTFTQKMAQYSPAFKPTLSNGSIVTDTTCQCTLFCNRIWYSNLKGLSAWQKAEAIISVAHPDFRDSLVAEAEKLKYGEISNKIDE